MDAFRVDYVTEVFTIGGGFGPDRTDRIPSTAFYVPSREVALFRNPGNGLIIGPPHLMYTAVVGESAGTEYRKLMETLGNVTPEEIKVGESFVEWIQHLHAIQNPPVEVYEVLSGMVRSRPQQAAP